MPKQASFTFANKPLIDHMMNRWDICLLILLFSVLFFLGLSAKQMAQPYDIGHPAEISLSITMLPAYALYTVMRLFIALGFSLAFTLLVGTLAAKNRKAEQVLIPTLDILQSVPVLSFLSISVTGFIRLFPNSQLGPECACLFAIFTAQVWNITFSFYQSLKTTPEDLKEMATMFCLSPWQRFWKLDVPFSMSGLIWNMMLSMSASWFFVVISEAIIVAHQKILLPGIGSYIALAIQTKNLSALGYAMLTMSMMIILYDQLVFKPLIAWSEKFKSTANLEEEPAEAWLLDWLRASQLVKHCAKPLRTLKDAWLQHSLMNRSFTLPTLHIKRKLHTLLDILWYSILLLSLAYLGIRTFFYLHQTLPLSDFIHVLMLGAVTAVRVLLLILLSSLVWLPVGIWIGLNPKWTKRIQPVIQLLAAFPVNLFYPLFVILILEFQLNVQIWLTPLMILGAQWYILFNVIAGASQIPTELTLVANNLGLKGWTWWKRLAIPSVFPFYITGAITASGGAWNASIVAECVRWGQTTLQATGLGAYIQENTLQGHFEKIVLGTCVMCLYVLAFNHLLWRPLYRLAVERFTVEGG